MTRSPYGPLENGLLTFQVSSGYTTDAYTGEEIPTLVSEVYRCNLRSARVPQRIVATGIDRLDEYLEGTLLEPHQFGTMIRPGLVAQATYSGRTGTAELVPSQDNYPILNDLTRERFSVLFRQVGGGNYAD